MKGFTHFMTGLALATCFPAVVEQGALGSLLPLLGGIGGLLPDTLDFKIARYWEHYHAGIDPCAEPYADPDPAVTAEAMAGALAGAIHETSATGETRNVQFYAWRLGLDCWRRYEVGFLAEEAGDEISAVRVRAGPLVGAGGRAYPESAPDAAEAVCALAYPCHHTYSKQYTVESFDGPSFRLVRAPASDGEGDVVVAHFLDWHHRWTHSLLLALAVGLVVGGVLALGWGITTGMWGGFLTALGFAAHALEDQLGHMGCNLWWPLTRQRRPGPGLWHSGDVLPNALTVWSALALILYNLDRAAAFPRLPARPYLAITLLLPWTLVALRSLLRK